ncbi:MAG: manganese transporter [Flavobacteriales bacterium]|nr:manganese transporter [Flavobacteriales bacterium]
MRKLLIHITALLFIACASPSESDSNTDGRLKIVCTTGMLGDAVKEIVGDQAEVTYLMGPGVDPHLYKATQGDLKLLTNADVIIYNGLHLEGKMGEVFEKLENRKQIIVAADGIPKEKLINSTDFQGAYDPHLWFDVSLWEEVCNYLGKTLSKLEGVDKEMIRSQSYAYSDSLKALHQWVTKEMAKVADSQRVLITAHDAFGYFGRAYDVEVKGLQGISTLSEYGLKDVSDLVNYISDRNIKAVFVESSVSDRSLNAVVQGCKEKGHQVHIGGTLFSDAMGEAKSAEGKYIGMVRYNVNTIVEALK